MTGLACYLLIVGACDLVRAGSDHTRVRSRVLLSALGTALLCGAAIAVDAPRSGWWAWAVAAACLIAWENLSAAALALKQTITQVPGLLPTLATLALTIGLGAMLLAGSNAGELPSTHDVHWLDVPSGDPERWLLIVGVLVVQLATANVLVRMLLDVAGVPAAVNEKAVKGGRLLGPMERVFIVSLAVAGQPTMASAIVAAKALLRFPEVQHRGDATDTTQPNRTEYLLLGSFSSWLIALLGVGLTLVHH